MRYRDEERGVCDDSFAENAARVACRELYGSPNYISFSHGHDCEYDDFWTDDIICEGDE